MKKVLILLLLLAIGFGVSAQNLYVQPIDNNEQIAFSLAELEITFSNRTMTVGQTWSFQLNNVRNLSFVQNTNEPPTNITMNFGNDKIRLFPNPVKDELTLSIQMPTQNLSYRIFDMAGRQLKTENINSETTTINVQNFQVGNYVLKLIQSGQEIQSFKIIKQ
jgi:hypothetical protein